MFPPIVTLFLKTPMTDAPMPSANTMVDRLASFEGLGALPRAELQWIADHGELRRYEAGELVADAGDTIDMLWICLEGGIAIDVDRGAGPRRTMEWGPGDVSGLLPYSRMTTTPGHAYTLVPTESLVIDRSLVPQLTRECPEFTAMTVHLMLDRARTFNARDLHDEKMVSLGRLAAGLAHELNNPAAAALSASRSLARELLRADDAARALGAAGLTPDQVRRIDEVRAVCMATPSGSVYSPTERADREDQMIRWLEMHGADPEHAAALADTPATVETLDSLAAAVPTDALDAAVEWIATGCGARALALDVERASHRIHELVTAVKRFSYMDRATTTESIDLRQSVADTLSVLAWKAKAKSAEIRIDMPDDLPTVMGTGSELNQVWLNLIDNALHAIGESGTIDIVVRTEPGRVTVGVVDDGPGVPPDLRAQIFDPFFTTKEQGEGTGLGLDIARTIVRRHGGEIRLESRPGRTEFCVALPVSG